MTALDGHGATVRAAQAPTGPAPDRLSRVFGAGSALPLAAHRLTFPPLPAPSDRPNERIVDAVERAGLRGRGGAGFPTATKLRAVASRGAAVVVANGSEGEPVSAKDKTLLVNAPHLVIDGALLAASAVGATEVVVAVERGSAAVDAVRAALFERAHAPSAPIRRIEVPRRFVAGEETALVQLVNGGEAKPTLTPPRPFERGVAGRPTLVSNVETLAHLATIVRWGPAWFRSVGTDAEPGTALVTVSGAVARPGVFEVALGTPLASVVDAAGGPTGGVQALLVGGYYGTWISGRAAATADLSEASLRPLGASVGCGAIVVLPDAACGLAETARLAAWLAGETAGQCGPCVHGLRAIAGACDDLAAARQAAESVQLLHRWSAQVEGRGACRFPDGVVRLVRSALTVFADDVTRHSYGVCDRAAGVAHMHVPEPETLWR